MKSVLLQPATGPPLTKEAPIAMPSVKLCTPSANKLSHLACTDNGRIHQGEVSNVEPGGGGRAGQGSGGALAHLQERQGDTGFREAQTGRAIQRQRSESDKQRDRTRQGKREWDRDREYGEIWREFFGSPTHNGWKCHLGLKGALIPKWSSKVRREWGTE